MFPPILMAKSTHIIHHNQLLMTKHKAQKHKKCFYLADSLVQCEKLNKEGYQQIQCSFI